MSEENPLELKNFKFDHFKAILDTLGSSSIVNQEGPLAISPEFEIISQHTVDIEKPNKPNSYEPELEIISQDTMNIEKSNKPNSYAYIVQQQKEPKIFIATRAVAKITSGNLKETTNEPQNSNSTTVIPITKQSHVSENRPLQINTLPKSQKVNKTISLGTYNASA